MTYDKYIKTSKTEISLEGYQYSRVELLIIMIIMI
jgi:hypothetical protein